MMHPSVWACSRSVMLCYVIGFGCVCVGNRWCNSASRGRMGRREGWMRGTIGESRIAPADCLARKDVRVLLTYRLPVIEKRKRRGGWGAIAHI